MRLLCLLFVIINTFTLAAQERVTTFGIQFKPIVPSNLFRTGAESTLQKDIEFHMRQRVGHAFGGVIRHGFTRNFSLESGINFVRRNYQSDLFNTQTLFRDTTKFRIIGYEIPVMGMVFVRLTDFIYMDVAFGAALDMFPSDVGSNGRTGSFYQRSFRNPGRGPASFSWAQTGLLANVGFEFRTPQRGYYYIGASYHRPFRPIYNALMYHEPGPNNVIGFLQLSGNYLTIDLRYFFHEDPKPKQTKVKDEDLPGWMRYGK